MKVVRWSDLSTCCLYPPENIPGIYFYLQGYVVAQLVEHCATSRKVAGSIPDGVTGIFH
jgi:hypothetical protein